MNCLLVQFTCLDNIVQNNKLNFIFQPSDENNVFT